MDDIVKTSSWSTRSEATTTRNIIKTLGYPDALIVTMDISLEKAQSWNLPLSNSLYRQALANNPKQVNNDLTTLYKNGILNASSRGDSSGLLKAIPYFAQIINSSTDSDSFPEARFQLGQIYINLYLNSPKTDVSARSNYVQAGIDVLKEYVNKFPNGTNAALAQKKIGDCEHALSDYYSARLQRTADAYKKVLEQYGDSSVAPFAQMEYAGVTLELARNRKLSYDTVQQILRQSKKTILNHPYGSWQGKIQ